MTAPMVSPMMISTSTISGLCLALELVLALVSPITVDVGVLVPLKLVGLGEGFGVAAAKFAA